MFIGNREVLAKIGVSEYPENVPQNVCIIYHFGNIISRAGLLTLYLYSIKLIPGLTVISGILHPLMAVKVRYETASEYISLFDIAPKSLIEYIPTRLEFQVCKELMFPGLALLSGISSALNI